MPAPLPAPGHMGVDYEQRVDFARLRDYRLGRATQSLESSQCGAFLLFGGSPHVGLGQGAENHDLVILQGDLYSREPAVWEPTGKPTFDRTELFLIHVLHNYTAISGKSRRVS